MFPVVDTCFSWGRLVLLLPSLLILKYYPLMPEVHAAQNSNILVFKNTELSILIKLEILPNPFGYFYECSSPVGLSLRMSARHGHFSVEIYTREAV